MWLFINLLLKFALKITDIMVYLQRIPHFWPQVVVLDQDTVTIGRLSARNTTSFLLLASKTFNRHASLHACTCRNRKQAMTKYFFPFRSLDWRPIDPPTFILVPPQVSLQMASPFLSPVTQTYLLNGSTLQAVLVSTCQLTFSKEFQFFHYFP